MILGILLIAGIIMKKLGTIMIIGYHWHDGITIIFALWWTNIAIENGPVEIVVIFPLKMVIFHCYVSSPEDNPPILDLIGMIIGYHWISQTSPLSPASPAAIFCWPSHCLPPIDLWGFIHLAVLAALCSTTFFKDMLESVYMCLLQFGLTYIYIFIHS